MKLNSMFSGDGSKKEKYGRKKVIHPSGLKFDSMLESAVYDTLCLMKRAGEIKEIQCQDSVYLTEAKILFKPDFKCTKNDDTLFWVEAKGMITQTYAIKKRLWEYYGPGDLQIFKGSHRRPILEEILKVKT